MTCLAECRIVDVEYDSDLTVVLWCYCHCCCKQLPCGVREEVAVLEPRSTRSEAQALACTQPFGLDRVVGWSYGLQKGAEYVIHLVFSIPSPHGHSGVSSSDEARLWRGVAVSNALVWHQQ